MFRDIARTQRRVSHDHYPGPQRWASCPCARSKGVLSGVAQQLNSADLERVETRRKELTACLDRAIAPGRVVKALAQIGLTASDIAIATGANRRTAAGWLEEDQPAIKKKKHQQRLRELKEVTRFIVGNGAVAYQEADWLRDPNRAVDFTTPLELIRDGGWKVAGRIYCDDVVAEVPSIFQADEQPQRAGVPHPSH
jgi:hypothetical protein